MLVDPKDLTQTERNALNQISRLRLIRVRNAYANGTIRVSLITVENLARRQLVKEVVERARKTVMLTGTGNMVKAVMDERTTRKEAH